MDVNKYDKAARQLGWAWGWGRYCRAAGVECVLQKGRPALCYFADVRTKDFKQ